MRLDRSDMKRLINLSNELNPKEFAELKEKDRRIIALVKEAFDNEAPSIYFDNKKDPDQFLKSFESKVQLIKKTPRNNDLISRLEKFAGGNPHLGLTKKPQDEREKVSESEEQSRPTRDADYEKESDRNDSYDSFDNRSSIYDLEEAYSGGPRIPSDDEKKIRPPQKFYENIYDARQGNLLAPDPREKEFEYGSDEEVVFRAGLLPEDERPRSPFEREAYAYNVSSSFDRLEANNYEQLLETNYSNFLQDKTFYYEAEAIKPEPTMDAKLFAHIHADEFGSPSKYEGNANATPLKFVVDFLLSQKADGNSTYGLSDEDLKTLQNTVYDGIGSNIDSKALTEALSQGKPFLILGGWNHATGGHAVYYELIPEKDGTLSFRIYNLGAGGDKASDTHGNPIVEWRGISRDKFLATEIIKEHLTLTHIGESQTATYYDENDVYKGLFAYLDPKEVVIVSPKIARPLKMQRAGLCTYRSLLAFLSSRMADTDFKKLKIDLKYKSLSEFQEKLEDEGATFSEKQLLQKSVRKFSRSLIRLRNEGVVDDDYLEASLSLIETSVDTPYREIREQRHPISTVKGDAIPTLYDLKTPSLMVEAASDELVSPQFLSHQLKALDLQDPKVLTKIEALREKAMKAWEAGSNHEPHLFLEELIRTIPDHVWLGEGLSQSECQERILLLNQILKDYFKTCFTSPSGGIISPQKIFILYKMFFLQKELIKQFNPKLIEEISFSMPFNAGANTLFYMDLTSDEKEALKHYQTEAEFKGAKRKTPASYYYDRDDSSLISDYREPVRGNGFSLNSFDLKLDKEGNFFETFVFDHFPEVLDQEKKLHKGFHEFDRSKKEGILIGSDHFPDWFKALRENYLYSSFMLYEPLTYSPGLDRTIPLAFSFTHKDFTFNKGSETYVLLSNLWNQPFLLTRGRSEKDSQYLPKAERSESKTTFKLVDFLSDISEKELVNPRCNVAVNGELKRSANTSRSYLEFIQKLSYVKLGENVSLISLLELFTESPELLSDPDTQIYFQKIFLKQEHLFKEPHFANFVEAFFDKMQARALEDNQIQPYVFMRCMKRYKDSFTGNNRVQEELRDLRALLNQVGLETESRKALYAEMIGCFSKMESLSVNDLEDLVIAEMFLKQHPFAEGQLSFYQKKEIEVCFLKNSFEIKDYFTELPNEKLKLFCNRLAKALDQTFEDSEWKLNHDPKDGRPLFGSSSGITIDIFKKEMRANDSLSLQTIPEAIRSRKEFKTLFPEVKEGKLLPNGSFHFIDSDGNNAAVSIREDQLIVEKQFFGRTPYALVSKDKFLEVFEGQVTPKLQSLSLIEEFDVWVNEPIEGISTLILTDKKTKEPIYYTDIYQRTNDDKSFEIDLRRPLIRLKDGAELFKARHYYSHFEDPLYTHEIFTKNGGYELEFKRYGLTFKTKEAGDKLYSDQYDGFYILENFHMGSLSPYEHYLTLINDKKEMKFIFPFHHAASTKEEAKDVFEIKYSIDLNIDHENPKNQTLYVYDLIDGKLEAKSRTALLYLAEVYLLNQKYKEAHALLNRYGRKLSAFTKKERTILEKISSMDKITGNKEGDAVGIQLLASHLLVKNALNFSNGKKGSSELSLLRENYESYLKSRKNSTFVQLKKEEEKEIRRIIEYKEDTFQQSRVAPPIHIITKIPETLDLMQEWFPFQRVKNRPPIADFSITRAFMAQQRLNFFEAYRIAKDTTEEGLPHRERLRAAITYAKAMPDFFAVTNHPEKIIMLEQVLLRPELYPDFSQKFIYEDTFKLVEITNGLLAEKSSVEPFFDRELNGKNKDLSEKRKPIPEREIERAMLNSQDRRSILSSWKEKVAQLSEDFYIVFDPEIHSRAIDDKGREKKSFLETLSDFYESLSNGTKKRAEHPLIHSETIRLSGDLTELKKSSQIESKKILLKSVPALKDEISSKQEKAKQGQLRLEEILLNKANKNAKAQDENLIHSLMKTGGLLRPITLQDVLTNFAKGSPEDLMALNPALTKEEVKDLYILAHQYLEQGVRLNKMNRMLVLISSIEDRVSKGKSPDFLLQNLYQELSQKPNYNSLERPAFLAFEYFADISLREKQVDLLEKFIKGDRESSNQIAELIMGSGKSAVLMPILGFMRADGKNISILIASPSLFPRMSEEIDPALHKAYAMGLRTFHFDRDTNFDKLTLKNILSDLKAIQKNRDCLIMTSKSIHCLLLKYIEKANEHYTAYPPKDRPSQELLLMGEILTLLSSEGVPLLDEADTLLSILHEVSFSLGEKTILNGTQVEVIGMIYRELYFNPDIVKLANIETGLVETEGAPALTEEIYHSEIKQKLATAFLEALKDFSSLDLALQDKVRKRFNNLDEEDKKSILSYLTRDKNEYKKGEEAYLREDKEIRNILALAGLEISTLLPHTLTRGLNENYGLNKKGEGMIAIPFKGSQTPNVGSQFASTAIMTNYTYQIYAKEKIPSYVIESEIKRLQIAARKEMEEKGKDLHEVEAWEEFNLLKGELNLSLFNLNAYQIGKIVEQINKDPEKRLRMARKLILPRQEVFLRKLNSNAMTLASFLNRISGFTGTLFNASSMHRKIKPEATLGTDSYTISLLWQNSFNDVIQAPLKSAEELRNELPFNVDMIIDAGGYFKDLDNEENAQKLFLKYKKPVVYFDKEGVLVVYSDKGILPFDEAKLKKQDRITFLDQVYTTGSNVLQHEDAQGVLTIGSEMMLRDLLQSAWRMRGLDKGQKIHFYVDERCSQIIYETLEIPKETKLNFSHILAFCIINQAKRQGKDNEKGFYLELNEIKQKLLLDILLDAKISETDKRLAFEALGNSWIKEDSENADDQYGKLPEEIDSNRLIEDEAEKLILALKGLPGSEEAIKEVSKVKQHYIDKLPKKTLTHASVESSTMEQEQQKISELESDKQVEFFAAPSKLRFIEINYKNGFKEATFNPELVGIPAERRRSDSDTPIFPLSNYFEHFEELRPFAKDFDDITISMNMLSYPYRSEMLSRDDFQFFGPYRTQIHYIYVDENEGKFILISNKHADALITKNPDAIYNLGLGYINPSQKPSKEVLVKVVKTKFLAGVSSYTPEERKILKEWLIESGFERMEKFFLTFSLAGSATRQEAYKQSGLKRLFHEIRSEESLRLIT